MNDTDTEWRRKGAMFQIWDQCTLVYYHQGLGPPASRVR
jgi:hypothetical protein